jgi:endo-1,4-beta-mannosidase
VNPSSPWLGVNFWSRAGGPLMWRAYDRDVVDAELAVLAEHGLNTTRSFFYWPDFMPEPGRLDERLVGHYATFLDQHLDHGLRTVPTFVVGHMSGQNWSPSWRGDRDLYEDVWMVAQQAWFIERLTRRFKDHPAVDGWLISNEMPIYADPVTRGRPEAHEAITAWAQLMVQAVHAAGARLVRSGGIEVAGR